MLQDYQLSEDDLTNLFPDEQIVPFEVEEMTDAMKLAGQTSLMPDDAIIIDNPIDRYYRTLRKGEKPDPNRIIVAKESFALRSILPLVDNQLQVEVILDPGCQVIAMSEDVCHELSLSYDPTVVVNMQSANGAVDPSLGLACNVAFYLGELTFYMQVHVIRNPAYDI